MSVFTAWIKLEGRTDMVQHGYNLGTDRKVAEMFAAEIAEAEFYFYSGNYARVERVELRGTDGPVASDEVVGTYYPAAE